MHTWRVETKNMRLYSLKVSKIFIDFSKISYFPISMSFLSYNILNKKEGT